MVVFPEWEVLLTDSSSQKCLYDRKVSLIMNTDAEVENVADRLNSKLDSGPKAEVKKTPLHEKSHWEALSKQKHKFGAPWKWMFASRLLAGKDPVSFLSELYRQDIGDWHLGLSFLSSLAIVAVYVAGSGTLNPVRDFSFLDLYTIYGKHAHLMWRNYKCYLYLESMKFPVPRVPYGNTKCHALVFF